MKYCFDIDGTICSTDSSHNYELAEPYQDVIDYINGLYPHNEITLFTARGSSSGKDWHSLTISQLNKWEVKYHNLIDKNKPSWDIFIDDKAINAIEWRKTLTPKKIGFIAGCFDVIHPGYIEMFKTAKEHCNYLVVGLHEDPSIERGDKLKPILSFSERLNILTSIKYIDSVQKYNTEHDLVLLLKEIKPDIRFLGEDYKNKNFTGRDLNILIHYFDRSHNWSTTKFKNLIYNQIRISYEQINTVSL
jgi:glycerol-3-phosphate cytidylyltransferase